MASWKPLIYSVGLLVLVGLVFPGILSYFVDLGSLPSNSLTTGISNFINADYTINFVVFTFDANPFSWLGGTVQGYLGNSVLYLAYFPGWLIVSIVLMVVLSFVYFVATLLRGN